MRKQLVLAVSVLLVGGVNPLSVFADDSTLKKQLFESTKTGIVSVFTSANHGSGFLIDDSGLILTSSQNVQDGKDHLRVKFSSGEVVRATLVVDDIEHDTAILRVNMVNIPNHQSLTLSPEREKIAVVGDEVYAVGSSFELTEPGEPVIGSKVSEVKDEFISVSSTIVPAVLGGPLLNKKGEVIGINSVDAGMPAAPGCVPVSLASRNIREAKAGALNNEQPEAALLPDIPKEPYRIDELVKNNPDVFKDRNHKEYTFDSGYFTVCVLTPPEGQNRIREAAESQENEAPAKEKPEGKSTKTKKNDDVALNNSLGERPGNELGFMQKEYYDKAVVTLLVMPRPKFAKDSKKLYAAKLIGAAALGFGAGCLGPAGIPLLFIPMPPVHDKKAVKKDFQTLSLVSADGKPVAEPISSGRAPFTKATMSITGCDYPELVDKSFMGVYTFDARCFDTAESLKLAIAIEGKEKKIEIPFPDSAKKLILDDFKPYWDYVAKTTEREKQM